MLKREREKSWISGSSHVEVIIGVIVGDIVTPSVSTKVLGIWCSATSVSITRSVFICIHSALLNLYS